MGVASSAAVLVAGCSSDPDPDDPGPDSTPDGSAEPTGEPEDGQHRVVTKDPIQETVIPEGEAGVLAVSQAVFESATAVVVARIPEAPTSSPTPPDDASPSPEPSGEATAPTEEDPETTAPAEDDPMTAAVAAAEQLGIPLLLDGPELIQELDRLQTRAVVAFAASDLDVGDREVLDGEAGVTLDGLPREPGAPDALALVLEDEEVSPMAAANLAVAGIDVETLAHPDPRVSAESVQLVKDHPEVLAVGAAFGEPERFNARLEAARTLPELSGGGVLPFPGRMMVALYGHPSGPTLGVLGEQGPAESVALVQEMAAEYQEFSDKPVIGCFEIITTVATASAGDDGNYSRAWPIETIMPLVDAAEDAGVYCVLDLQPGYNTFLDQARIYEEVLKRPHVGLALDPEWRLVPPQRHMTVIGQVHADEINETGAWLAEVVRQNNLPPKVLVLHQFQTRMIIDRESVDTSLEEIQYLMHADGHGTHGQKLETWNVLRRGLSEDIRLGWKNFIDEDSPMMTVEQTMTMVEPRPDFVSYQ